MRVMMVQVIMKEMKILFGGIMAMMTVIIY